MCGKRFYSMNITEEMRDYVAETGISDEAVFRRGTDEKSREFIEKSVEHHTKV